MLTVQLAPEACIPANVRNADGRMAPTQKGQSKNSGRCRGEGSLCLRDLSCGGGTGPESVAVDLPHSELTGVKQDQGHVWRD